MIEQESPKPNDKEEAIPEKDNDEGFNEEDVTEDTYLDDIICPQCGAEVSPDAEFCDCGFYFKAAKNSGDFVIVLTVIIVALGFLLFLFRFDSINSMVSGVTKNFAPKEIALTTSPIARIKDVLRQKPYYEKFLSVYQKDIKNENILIVVVKPDYWRQLKPEAKEKLISQVEDAWKDVYPGENPQAEFGNR